MLEFERFKDERDTNIVNLTSYPFINSLCTSYITNVPMPIPWYQAFGKPESQLSMLLEGREASRSQNSGSRILWPCAINEGGI